MTLCIFLKIVSKLSNHCFRIADGPQALQNSAAANEET